MNYLMVDISGKVLNYDVALCEAIYRALGVKDRFLFFAANIIPQKIHCPSKKMLSLVPFFLRNSENKVKRAVKALEGLVNYFYLVLYLKCYKVDVLHLQWLPFLEVCSVERFFLRLITFISPKTKVFLTVHNIYPHNFDKKRKEIYQRRFNNVLPFIDGFIVHLQVSKNEFLKEFSAKKENVFVVPHGVFKPANLVDKSRVRDGRLKLIMYGNQSYYKGTDLLIDALNMLSEDELQHVHTTIIGQIGKSFLSDLQSKATNLDVEWIPKYVSDDLLYEKIMESDVIVIPYREISQSGVLLLALAFDRLIIASDLPSFKETLEGLPEDLFFEKENVKSFAQQIRNFLNHPEKIDSYLDYIANIREKYSWDRIAKVYLNEVYGEKAAC